MVDTRASARGKSALGDRSSVGRVGPTGFQQANVDYHVNQQEVAAVEETHSPPDLDLSQEVYSSDDQHQTEAESAREEIARLHKEAKVLSTRLENHIQDYKGLLKELQDAGISLPLRKRRRPSGDKAASVLRKT